MGVNFLMSEYFKNILEGLKTFWSGMTLTLDHMKNKKDLVSTLQYPHEKWPVTDRNIGFDLDEYNQIRSRLHVDIDDCIGCLQCERACPVDCIKIDTVKPPKDSEYDCGLTSNNTQKKMLVPRFTIDMSECMYCNLCVHPCPEECIYMVGGPNEEKHNMDYEFSKYTKDGLIFEFAETTDQDLSDIGAQNYIDKRNEVVNRRDEGTRLEGLVEELEKAKIEAEKAKENSDNIEETDANDSGLTIKIFIKYFCMIIISPCVYIINIKFFIISIICISFIFIVSTFGSGNAIFEKSIFYIV